MLEVIPEKAVSTHEQQTIWIRQLRGIFGKLPITGVKPRLIYKYVDVRNKKKVTVIKNEKTGKEKHQVTGGPVAAHWEIEVFSHAFAKAVEWGYPDRHPFNGEVRLKSEKPGDRYVEDREIVEVPALSPFLFCNKFGRGYIDEETGRAEGWDSMWQRFIDRVLKETVTQSFSEHDMRAKCASDAATFERARALLSHADERPTARIYRRNQNE